MRFVVFNFQFAATTLMRPGFSWTCQKIDYSEDPISMRVSKGADAVS